MPPASRATALRPRFEWAEVADIVNAALERHRARLAGHALETDLARELPLVYVDQNLIEQALGHVIDNAIEVFPARLADPHRRRVEDGALAAGGDGSAAPGLAAEELPRLGERFFRGDAHRRQPPVRASACGSPRRSCTSMAAASTR